VTKQKKKILFPLTPVCPSVKVSLPPSLPLETAHFDILVCTMLCKESQQRETQTPFSLTVRKKREKNLTSSMLSRAGKREINAAAAVTTTIGPNVQVY